VNYLREHPDRVWELLQQHLRLTGWSVLIAMLIGIPLGIIVTRIRWLEGPVINLTGIMYTIPSLALFVIMIPYFGLGERTAIIALVMYSLLAIVRNTAAGIDSVSPATLDAARGMGMTGVQRLAMVELPLALPVILVGIRIATVSTIGIATIAAVIGAGGLGRMIFDGMRTLDNDRIFAGALVASALALIADWVLGRLGDFLRRDLKTSGRR
jgi:osmoprotectant transport system permease protein